MAYQYIEDNGGGIFLFVFNEAGALVAGIGNLEYAGAGEGAEVQDALRADALEAVHTWEGRLEDPRPVYDAFCADSTSEVVADERGVYPDRMGRAALRYFGIAER
jgi:hypothetical protein